MMASALGATTSLRPVSFETLRGWDGDDHDAALAAFKRSCDEILEFGHGFKRPSKYAGTREDWQDVCRAALDTRQAKSFFEDEFMALAVDDGERPQGLLTGYYEPEAEGSLRPGKDYPVPIFAKPSDLVPFDAAAEAASGVKYGRFVGGTALPYFTRQEIERGALQGRGLELAWLKRWEDAFFIHIQGSGRIRLQDGEIVRLSYAAKTGLPYTGIGGILIDRGILTRETNSMQAIRQWMSDNPRDARELMWQNRSFVFFRKVDVSDPALGALGAQQVHLTPQRSLAVDRSLWSFGTPIWIETHTPREVGGQSYNRLMIAQDTGTAIKGHARGDVYWGWGESAAQTAGRMKSPGRFVVLLPKAVVLKLNLAK